MPPPIASLPSPHAASASAVGAAHTFGRCVLSFCRHRRCRRRRCRRIYVARRHVLRGLRWWRPRSPLRRCRTLQASFRRLRVVVTIHDALTRGEARSRLPHLCPQPESGGERAHDTWWSTPLALKSFEGGTTSPFDIFGTVVKRVVDGMRRLSYVAICVVGAQQRCTLRTSTWRRAS